MYDDYDDDDNDVLYLRHLIADASHSFFYHHISACGYFVKKGTPPKHYCYMPNQTGIFWGGFSFPHHTLLKLGMDVVVLVVYDACVAYMAVPIE